MTVYPRPLGRYVLLKEFDQELGGIALPPGVDIPKRGCILAVGRDCEQVEVGETVMWMRDGEAADPRINDERLVVIHEVDILLVLDEVPAHTTQLFGDRA